MVTVHLILQVCNLAGFQTKGKNYVASEWNIKNLSIVGLKILKLMKIQSQ